MYFCARTSGYYTNQWTVRRVETAPPVVAKVHKPGKATPDPLRGLYEATINGKLCVVEYEPDTDLRDSEQVPLLEDGGVEAFTRSPGKRLSDSNL